MENRQASCFRPELLPVSGRVPAVLLLAPKDFGAKDAKVILEETHAKQLQLLWDRFAESKEDSQESRDAATKLFAFHAELQAWIEKEPRGHDFMVFRRALHATLNWSKDPHNMAILAQAVRMRNRNRRAHIINAFTNAPTNQDDSLVNEGESSDPSTPRIITQYSWERSRAVPGTSPRVARLPDASSSTGTGGATADGQEAIARESDTASLAGWHGLRGGELTPEPGAEDDQDPPAAAAAPTTPVRPVLRAHHDDRWMGYASKDWVFLFTAVAL